MRSKTSKVASLVLLATALAVPAGLASAATEDRPAPTPEALLGTVPTPTRSDLLTKEEQAAVARAADAGDRVTLLFAAEPGGARELAAALEASGAEVGHVSESISYVRATVDAGDALTAAALRGVEAVDVDTTIPFDDPEPGGDQPPTEQVPPSAETPRANPYMPTRDTGAATWVDRRPASDGRGVTVAIIDTGIDLAHPALATTTTGEPKVVDWVTYTHPSNENDPTWVRMDPVSDADLVADGLTLPERDGTSQLRRGVFNERDARLGGEVGNDVNRDGNPAGSSGLFDVLWDDVTDEVWVDADQDGDFADEQPMTDYKVARDVGTFGTDNLETPVREAMSFVVQTASSSAGTQGYVNIGIVSGAHGTHVAGIVAANGMFGGQMSGAAPGAQLVSVRACLFVAGCTTHALLEGMIYAAEVAQVDVINMSIGGLPALNDGNNARAELYNRLIDVHGVQIFLSAGNSGAGLNTVGDPAVASKAVAVGSSIRRSTWQSNYGSDSAFARNLHPFSSRGPREDGGFKPQVVAPGAAVSTTPTWQNGAPVAGTYPLPPGYGMSNGTSMASPQAAGMAALLLSHAAEKGVSATPAELRLAMSSGATRFGRYQATDQGNGLLKVRPTARLLRDGVSPVTITSSVEVNTVLSHLLKTPGFGEGIHDREGVAAGDSYSRVYTFTRTSGPSGPISYDLRWVGNDDTFGTEPQSITLDLDQPTTLEIFVQPATAGVHSAILQLDDPSSPGVEHQTMNTVVAADQLGSLETYSVTKTGEIGRNQAASFFVDVPAGTPALKIDMAAGGSDPGVGQVRFLRFTPQGVNLDQTSTTHCYNPPVAPSFLCNVGESPTSRTVVDPMAGVWEIVVEARRTSDAEVAPFSITASILGASVDPAPDVIPVAALGIPVEREYTLLNELGTFAGRATGVPLGSASISTPTIADLEQQQYPVSVPSGTTQIRATIGSPSDPGSDLDLLLYNCTSGSCVLAGQSAGSSSEESITVNNPAAGVWVVLVDAYSVPAGSTTFEYLDVLANASYGTVVVDDADAERPGGLTWTVGGTVTAQAKPAAGRVLLGQVQVRTSDNVLVGRGDVIVEEVVDPA